MSWLVVTAAACGLTLVGCAGPSGPATVASAASGIVSGTVRTYGGPEIGGTPAANGIPRGGAVVRFELDGHPAGSVITGATGRFTIRLPPGTYTVDACGLDTTTTSVTVTAAATTTADVGCQVP